MKSSNSMMLQRLLGIVVLLCFGSGSNRFQVSAQIHSCGLSDPKLIPVPDDATARMAVKLQYSPSGSLCILMRVTSNNGDNVDLDAFALNSTSTDYTIVPIARSYAKKSWEKSPGPYAQRTKIKKCSKTKRTCIVRFPLLRDQFPNLNDVRYYLVPMTHSLETFHDRLSRFLTQATFGPTRQELNDWTNTYDTTQKGFASWMKDQMNPTTTEMTMHRVYYRQRWDNGMKFESVSSFNTAPQNPCDLHSRWRDYAITGHDYGLYFNIEAIAGNKYLMSIKVNNVFEVRTVMDSFESTDDNASDDYSGAGEYQFCWSMGEGIGEPITYRPNPSSPCKYIKGGNPIIYLPTSVHTDAMDIINLPSRTSFDFVPGQLAVHRMQWVGGTTHRLLDELWDDGTTMEEKCTAFNQVRGYGQVYGEVSGEPEGYLWHYAGYAAVEENSIENPLSDGGVRGVGMSMRNCANVAKDFMNIESCFLSSGPTCVSSSMKATATIANNQVVCGSSGEVGNNRGAIASELNMAHAFESASGVLYGLNEWQKSNLFNNIAIWAPDQLRQRMAWALSQILVVTQFQLDNSDLSTEFFLHYHDIFVRNAFGNYRDVLKEVSYSPMMAEMLSYLESKSATWVKRWEDRDSRPDENFAREIMQLFSIGIYMLNQDGTIKKKDGIPIPSYKNSDIQTFARAWTGFRRQNRRGNLEGYWSFPNRIDPMPIKGEWRDQFPKMDLFGGYIGDTYPLCIDLPKQHFLRKGATYRLLGGHNMPEFHYEPWHWTSNKNLLRPLLNSTGALYGKICNDDGNSSCNFKPLITLDENIQCTSFECDVDNLRVVKVQENPDIYYEYVRPACVEMAFPRESSLKKVVDRVQDAMCVHRSIDQVAFQSCCPKGNTYARSRCEFTAERVSFGRSTQRCLNDPEGTNSTMCDWLNIYQPAPQCAFYAGGDYFDWYWTDQPCSIQAKVNSDGMIAIVHDPNFDINDDLGDDRKQRVVEHVDEDNANFFKVAWGDGMYPSSSNNCGNTSSCIAVPDGCLCDVSLIEKRVFKEAPTVAEVLDKCKIGFHDPTSFDDGVFKSAVVENKVTIYHKEGRQEFSAQTVFAVTDKGKVVYFKNQKSNVAISGTSFIFRNSPHFMSLAIPDTRDAIYETEAVLDMYFYHPNTAPFLAERFIQRFGISNPSPRYIQQVSKAFRTGKYRGRGESFGDGVYGNLESTVAAILLDQEPRSVILDKDPTSGSLREPFLKFIGFLRSMEYITHEHATAVRVEDLQQAIGQAPYTIPNVFSFFLPEYSAPGVIAKVGLKSPEAQVMNAPTIIGLLNGLFSLIDIGTSSCYSGFGGRTVYWCPGYQKTYDQKTYSHGRLGFQATNATVAEDVIDELATILTGGRLSSASRTAFADAFDTELNSNGETKALRLVQKLIISTPEFHSTDVMGSIGNPRPEAPDPEPSPNDYKAIVFLNLNGGMDGFNMLVPTCDDMFSQYQEVRGEVALNKGSLRPIDATGSGQVCNDFGLHQRLSFLQSLYDDTDLAFIANLGILQEPVDKSNWAQKHGNTALFAHNTQTEETAAVDIFDEYAGIGIGGRILDVLSEGIYNAGSVSVAGAAPPVVSNSSPLLVVDPFGYDKFNPVPWSPNVTPIIKSANPSTVVGSGFFAETWSEKLFQSLGENELLFAKYNGVKLSTTFPNTHTGRQLQSIAKLIQTKDDRGKDRDVFFAEREGYDLHFDIAVPLDILFKELDDAIESFVVEMRNKGIWDDVTVVCVSEFGRTLMGNTGNGTDHAWGGNYFVASGSLDGGKIMGEFPPDLRNDGPQAFAPGIVIPTTPWESVWSAVAEWFGVESGDMDAILPNRGVFSDLWSAADMYQSNSFNSKTNIFE